MDVDSPVKLKSEKKRLRLRVSDKRCLICGGNGKLVKPQFAGKRTFIKSISTEGFMLWIRYSRIKKHY